MKPILLFIVPLLLASPLTCQAFEYLEWHNIWGDEYKVKWLTDNPRIRAEASAFSEGSARRAALRATVGEWNLNPSDFRFNLTYEDGSVSIENDESEIWFTDDDDLLSDDAAVCITVFYQREIVEANVLFDVRKSWETAYTPKATLLPYGGSSLPFQPALLHELGHALGLRHGNDEYSIMGDAWRHVNANGDAVRYYPGEDACDGAVFLYSLNPESLEDVSVTHWKYSGASGEYSTHTRTFIRSAVNHRLSMVAGTEDSDPIFRVLRGQEVRLQFTLENSGASAQTPLVHFVLSDDSWIGPEDTLLDTRRPTVIRNDVYTTTQTLTIPNNLTRSQIYYLGIIVDPDNTIAEVREDNNATYVGILVE